MERFEQTVVTFETHDDHPWKHEAKAVVSEGGTIMLVVKTHEESASYITDDVDVITFRTPAQVDELIAALEAAKAHWFGIPIEQPVVHDEVWWEQVEEVEPGG